MLFSQHIRLSGESSGLAPCHPPIRVTRVIEPATLKSGHQVLAILSISGFVLRGGLMLMQSGLLYRRWMRSWPHVIDTLLLISGIWMAVNLHVHPGNSPWLTAKLVALLLYIGLGFVALRLGRSYHTRATAFVAAVGCYAYIGLVAMQRNPLPT
jgi:uncharacterized membrane protein SirB2